MDYSGWLKHTITVAPFTGKSAYGDPTYGAKVTRAARVEAKQVLVRKPGGQEVQAEHVIYTASAIGAQDRVWLPGVDSSDDSLTKVPAATNQSPNKSGTQILYRTML